MPGPEPGFVVCDSSGLGLLRALTVLLGARAGAADDEAAVASCSVPRGIPQSYACRFFRIFGNINK